MNNFNKIYNNDYANNTILEETILVSDRMGYIFSPKFYINRQYFDDYLIVYVIDGIFHLNQYGKHFEFTKNDCILMSLRDFHEYYTDKKDIVKIIWFHFKGYPIEGSMRLLKSKNLLPLRVENIDITSRIYTMFDILERKENHFEFRLSAIMYDIFSEITADVLSDLSNNIYDNKNFFRNNVILYIKNHITEPIDISSLCQNIGYTKSYFLKIYPDYFDIPPHKLILQEKIYYSCELLHNSNYSISQIAELLNFYDQSHFGKVFKNIYGISPLNYRNMNKKAL